MRLFAPVKRVLGLLGLVIFGVVLALLLLEIGLQVAAPLARPGLRPLQTSAAGGRELRILCLGDSHTYGIWVDPRDTYPARLQRRIAAWPGGVTVLNAGVPGMNSSQARELFPELLDRYQPDVVLLMVGVADFWNRDSYREEDYRGWRWVVSGGGLLDHSRVAKLVRLLVFNLRYGHDLQPSDAPFIDQKTESSWRIRGGGGDIDVKTEMRFDNWLSDIVVERRMLTRNLSIIAATAEARHVGLILMTYSTESILYGAVNQTYRDFAASAGVPLVDLGISMGPWVRPPFAAKAFFPDFHPRRAGYEIVARVLAARLPGLLNGSGEPEGRGTGG